MSFLDKYIQALSLVELSEQKTIVVDKNSKFCYVSRALLAQNGLNNYDLAGASYEAIPSIRQIASSCTSEDLECLENRKEQKYITSQNHNGEILLYLKQKSPIIDPVINEAIGVRVDFFPIYSLGHFKPYINSHIAHYDSRAIAKQSRDRIALTEIEELILFLLIMYVKPKVVTSQLNDIMGKNNSVSTIRNIIHQQLLRKFEVFTIEDLIDKAIFLGYDTILPGIMAEQFSIRII